VIQAQLYRLWPWLTLLMAVVLAACDGGSNGGNGAPGGY
jgi:hypothetical protein